MTTGTHVCPRPGCAKQIQNGVYADAKHWFELPLPIRSAIVRAWAALRDDKGDAVAAIKRYEDATTAAEVWWREHAGPGQLQGQQQLVAHMGLKTKP